MSNLTDTEIIKVFECCGKTRTIADCEKMKCPALTNGVCGYALKANSNDEADIHTEMYKDAFDLINRQQAEIERLNNGLAISKKETKRYFQSYTTAKSEARKEFAERLKERAEMFTQEVTYNPAFWVLAVKVEDIDNLLKEMG